MEVDETVPPIESQPPVTAGVFTSVLHELLVPIAIEIVPVMQRFAGAVLPVQSQSHVPATLRFGAVSVAAFP